MLGGVCVAGVEVLPLVVPEDELDPDFRVVSLVADEFVDIDPLLMVP
ncbi:hypothetical protein GCM10027341_53340 [Spirosoma knui]